MWTWLRNLLGFQDSPPSPRPEPGADEIFVPKMSCAPSFVGGRRVGRFLVGPYRCELFTDLEPVPDLLGAIRHAHVLVVLDETGICLYITAEANTMRATFGGGGYFLCAYPGEGCLTLADGDEYADLERFRTAAFDAVKRHFHLPADAPVEGERPP